MDDVETEENMATWIPKMTLDSTWHLRWQWLALFGFSELAINWKLVVHLAIVIVSTLKITNVGDKHNSYLRSELETMQHFFLPNNSFPVDCFNATFENTFQTYLSLPEVSVDVVELMPASNTEPNSSMAIHAQYLAGLETWDYVSSNSLAPFFERFPSYRSFFDNLDYVTLHFHLKTYNQVVHPRQCVLWHLKLRLDYGLEGILTPLLHHTTSSCADDSASSVFDDGGLSLLLIGLTFLSTLLSIRSFSHNLLNLAAKRISQNQKTERRQQELQMQQRWKRSVRLLQQQQQQQYEREGLRRRAVSSTGSGVTEFLDNLQNGRENETSGSTQQQNGFLGVGGSMPPPPLQSASSSKLLKRKKMRGLLGVIQQYSSSIFRPLKLFSGFFFLSMASNVCHVFGAALALAKPGMLVSTERWVISLFLGLGCLLSYANIIRYLSFRPRFYILTLTLYSSLGDAFSVFVGWVPVFLGVSLFGVILLGVTDTYSTLDKSLSCQTALMIGDSVLIAFESSRRWAGRLGQAYTFAWVLVSIAVLLRMLTAIFVMKYVHAKKILERLDNDHTMLRNIAATQDINIMSISRPSQRPPAPSVSNARLSVLLSDAQANRLTKGRSDTMASEFLKGNPHFSRVLTSYLAAK